MRYPIGRPLLLIVAVLGLATPLQAEPNSAAKIAESEAAMLGQLFDRAIEERGFQYLETRSQLLRYGAVAERFLEEKTNAEDWHARAIAGALLQRTREPQRCREAEAAVAAEMKEANRHFQWLRGGSHVSGMYNNVAELMPKVTTVRQNFLRDA